MYYFAYGSNMNHKQMRERCPSSSFVEKAFLRWYKFVYDGYSYYWEGAVANIIESKNDVVWGGLFKINKDNLAALDCYECYPKSYNREEMKIENEEDNSYNAVVYFRTGKKISKPSEDYLNKVIQGAEDCGLPEEYIKNNLYKKS